VRYGLVTGIHTADLDRALEVIDGVDTGMVKVNAPTAGVDFYLPFGGAKASSYGTREQGKAARDFYTFSRTVTLAPMR
jgi:alpha-ketoglutaric semialdehyde dehydrogenase